MDPTAPHRLPTASPPTPPAPASTHTTTRVTEQPFPGAGASHPTREAAPAHPHAPDRPTGPNPRDHPHSITPNREPLTTREHGSGYKRHGDSDDDHSAPSATR